MLSTILRAYLKALAGVGSAAVAASLALRHCYVTTRRAAFDPRQCGTPATH